MADTSHAKKKPPEGGSQLTISELNGLQGPQPYDGETSIAPMPTKPEIIIAQVEGFEHWLE
jgi:hypothetical protein